MTGDRVKGSVRFRPYFKVQTWDPVAIAWRDVQDRYPTTGDAYDFAREDLRPGTRIRLMRVTATGRAPLPDSERVIP